MGKIMIEAAKPFVASVGRQIAIVIAEEAVKRLRRLR